MSENSNPSNNLRQRSPGWESRRPSSEKLNPDSVNIQTKAVTFEKVDLGDALSFGLRGAEKGLQDSLGNMTKEINQTATAFERVNAASQQMTHTERRRAAREEMTGAHPIIQRHQEEAQRRKASSHPGSMFDRFRSSRREYPGSPERPGGILSIFGRNRNQKDLPVRGGGKGVRNSVGVTKAPLVRVSNAYMDITEPLEDRFDALEQSLDGKSPEMRAAGNYSRENQFDKDSWQGILIQQTKEHKQVSMLGHDRTVLAITGIIREQYREQRKFFKKEFFALKVSLKGLGGALWWLTKTSFKTVFGTLFGWKKTGKKPEELLLEKIEKNTRQHLEFALTGEIAGRTRGFFERFAHHGLVGLFSSYEKERYAQRRQELREQGQTVKDDRNWFQRVILRRESVDETQADYVTRRKHTGSRRGEVRTSSGDEQVNRDALRPRFLIEAVASGVISALRAVRRTPDERTRKREAERRQQRVRENLQTQLQYTGIQRRLDHTKGHLVELRDKMKNFSAQGVLHHEEQKKILEKIAKATHGSHAVLKKIRGGQIFGAIMKGIAGVAAAVVAAGVILSKILGALGVLKALQSIARRGPSSGRSPRRLPAPAPSEPRRTPSRTPTTPTGSSRTSERSPLGLLRATPVGVGLTAMFTPRTISESSGDPSGYMDPSIHTPFAGFRPAGESPAPIAPIAPAAPTPEPASPSWRRDRSEVEKIMGIPRFLRTKEDTPPGTEEKERKPIPGFSLISNANASADRPDMARLSGGTSFRPGDSSQGEMFPWMRGVNDITSQMIHDRGGRNGQSMDRIREMSTFGHMGNNREMVTDAFRRTEGMVDDQPLTESAYFRTTGEIFRHDPNFQKLVKYTEEETREVSDPESQKYLKELVKTMKEIKEEYQKNARASAIPSAPPPDSTLLFGMFGR